MAIGTSCSAHHSSLGSLVPPTNDENFGIVQSVLWPQSAIAARTVTTAIVGKPARKRRRISKFVDGALGDSADLPPVTLVLDIPNAPKNLFAHAPKAQGERSNRVEMNRGVAPEAAARAMTSNQQELMQKMETYRCREIRPILDHSIDRKRWIATGNGR
jgi:hypothetical protein